MSGGVETTWNPKTLSERQRLVFRLAAWGMSAATIAKTTSYSVEHIYRLLNTSSGQEALGEFRTTIEDTIARQVESAVRSALPRFVTVGAT